MEEIISWGDAADKEKLKILLISKKRMMENGKPFDKR